jgi:hypothetical protein
VRGSYGRGSYPEAVTVPVAPVASGAMSDLEPPVDHAPSAPDPAPSAGGPEPADHADDRLLDQLEADLAAVQSAIETIDRVAAEDLPGSVVADQITAVVSAERFGGAPAAVASSPDAGPAEAPGESGAGPAEAPSWSDAVDRSGAAGPSVGPDGPTSAPVPGPMS